MYILFFIVVIIFILIALFAFPSISPIPYFPSNKKDKELIIKALDLRNRQTVIDLGAGDGFVIFEAAKVAYEKKLNTKFIATEINPILLLILIVKRLLHPNQNNIKIMYADMFKMEFSSLTTNYSLLTTFYLYISPWHMEKTIKNIKKQIKLFSVVSYMYALPNIKERKILHGINKIYCYNLSL